MKNVFLVILVLMTSSYVAVAAESERENRSSDKWVCKQETKYLKCDERVKCWGEYSMANDPAYVITGTTALALSPIFVSIRGVKYLVHGKYLDLVAQSAVGTGGDLVEFTAAVKLKKFNNTGSVTKEEVQRVASIVTDGNSSLKICGDGERYPSYGDLVDIVALDF